MLDVVFVAAMVLLTAVAGLMVAIACAGESCPCPVRRSMRGACTQMILTAIPVRKPVMTEGEMNPVRPSPAMPR